MKGNGFRYLFLITFSLHIIAGCSVNPSNDAIESAIYRYYSNLGDHVVDMKIGEILPQPMEKLKYMGTKGYTVKIDSITIELGEDTERAGPHNIGQQVTLTGGVITIREDPAKKGEWIIVNVSENIAL
ncbi:MAG: hypothetical protein JSV21_01305 [Nitrospirota bacterium]|nr:MAG: hypothetical protein JSV21_01305 [Nitrospirota bacterium]